MPIRTLAEIDATGRKAARGCGCPWGLAEEAGKSARWLASHGLPGAEALAGMLAGRTECCTRTGSPCALAIGVSLADRATGIGTEPVVTDKVDSPLLVLASMGRASDSLDRIFALTWEGGGGTVARNALSIHGDVQKSAVTCAAIPENTGEGTSPTPASRHVSDAAWACLTQLSNRILVPASDASRAGAGAGTTDND